MKRLFLSLGMIALGIYAGLSFEAHYIQQTCESSDRPTVINGVAYLCLTGDQLEQIRALVRQIQSGRQA